LCQKVAVLEPAFEEEVAGRSLVLELCRECYDRAGEDEKWLKQQLRLLAGTTSSHTLRKGRSDRCGDQAGEPEDLEGRGAKAGQSSTLLDSVLAQTRLAKGLSRPALAQLTGIDRASIRKLELGLANARSSTLQKLAAALELPVEELGYLQQAKIRTRPRLTPKVRQALAQAERVVAVACEIVTADSSSAKVAPASELELEGGALLVKLRLERNLTQLELAQLCQLSRSLISRLENGDYTLKASSIKKVARVLGVSPVKLAPGRDFQLELNT
jgi:transcriptional regulator with XRE-family HTH domain